MSNIYIQEPPTNGKVLLVTSVGDIDVELWSKETPKACRNFVQLCMEGYYDDLLFHRIVPGFIAQTGDPTGTGHGGESIYGKPFRDEFHSRLRFNRRGLLGMANAGPNDNGSQFFFTLAEAPELNNKHTLFGKVTGNTVFNLIKLGEVEVENERPTYPLKIIKSKVLSDPFDDIVPRKLSKKHKSEDDPKKPRSKSKATKNFSLLSFGEEAEEDEEETNRATETMKTKSKSSHDLLHDKNLSSVPAVESEEGGPQKSWEEQDNEEQSDSSEKQSRRDALRKKLKKEESPVNEKDERKTTERLKHDLNKTELSHKGENNVERNSKKEKSQVTSSEQDRNSEKSHLEEKPRDIKKPSQDTKRHSPVEEKDRDFKRNYSNDKYDKGKDYKRSFHGEERERSKSSLRTDEKKPESKGNESDSEDEEFKEVSEARLKGMKRSPRSNNDARTHSGSEPEDLRVTSPRRKTMKEDKKQELFRKGREVESENQDSRKETERRKRRYEEKTTKGSNTDQTEVYTQDESYDQDTKRDSGWKKQRKEQSRDGSNVSEKKVTSGEDTKKENRQSPGEEKSPRDRDSHKMRDSGEEGRKPSSRVEELRKEVLALQRDIALSKKRKEQARQQKLKAQETAKQPPKVNEPPANDVLAAYKLERQKFHEKKKTQPGKGSKREDQTLALLSKFQERLGAARKMREFVGGSEEGEEDSTNEEEEEAEESMDYGWLSHKLKFESHNQKVLDANVNEEDRYTIFDPRNPLNQRRREASKQKSQSNKR